MQSEAADVFDLSREPRYMREAYGEGIHGRQLLITRRMLERGVRFVQVWSGAGQPWDNHDNLQKQHHDLAQQWDRPIAAFLADLKQRFGDRVAFCGGIDSQFVLNRPGVTPAEVRAEVRKRIDEMSAGGGYIAGPSHSVPYEKRLIDAMHSEIRSHGRSVYRS